MERVVDLLHWLLKRDDCYQSHLILSRLQSDAHAFLSFTFEMWYVCDVRSNWKCWWMSFDSFETNWNSSTGYAINMVNEHINSLAGIRLISIFTFNLLWQHTMRACAGIVQILSIYTYILSFICTWLTRNDGLFVALIFPMSFCSSNATGSQIGNSKVLIEKNLHIFGFCQTKKKSNFEAQNFYLLHSILYVRSRF